MITEIKVQLEDDLLVFAAGPIFKFCTKCDLCARDFYNFVRYFPKNTKDHYCCYQCQHDIIVHDEVSFKPGLVYRHEIDRSLKKFADENEPNELIIDYTKLYKLNLLPEIYKILGIQTEINVLEKKGRKSLQSLKKIILEEMNRQNLEVKKFDNRLFEKYELPAEADEWVNIVKTILGTSLDSSVHDGFIEKKRSCIGYDYPVSSTNKPFDKLADGRFFAYNAPLDAPLTYLSSTLEDFCYLDENNKPTCNETLYKLIPWFMLDIWVFERLFLVDADSTSREWEPSPEADNIIKHFGKVEFHIICISEDTYFFSYKEAKDYAWEVHSNKKQAVMIARFISRHC